MPGILRQRPTGPEAVGPPLRDPSTPLQITPQQVAWFETFGFLVLRGVFAEDMDRIREGFEEVFGQRRGAAPRSRQRVPPHQRSALRA